MSIDTPADIDAATHAALEISLDAMALVDNCTDPELKRHARRLEHAAHNLLAAVPDGYPTIIDAGQCPGGYVAAIVLEDGSMTWHTFTDRDSFDPVADLWDAALDDGTGWRFVIYDGELGLAKDALTPFSGELTTFTYPPPPDLRHA